MQPRSELDIQNSLTKVYAVELQTRTVSLIASSLFVLVFGLIFPSIVLITGRQQAMPDLFGTALVAPFSVVIAIFMIWSLRRWLHVTSLQLNNAGLVYRTPGLIIQTPWSNVERVNIRYGKAELILRTPATAYISFGKRFLQETTSAGRNIDRRIPLSIFSAWTPQSQLFQDIARFQVHLVHETGIIESRKKPF